jgi:hypothetical protein
MRELRMLGAAALVALLAACPGDRGVDDRVGIQETPTRMDTAPATAPMGATMHMAQIEPMHGSAVGGDAHMVPRDGRTDVRLTVRGMAVDQDIEARIHRGTCEAPGEAVANLSNLSADAGGTATSETDVGHPMTMLGNGQHVILLLPAGADAGQAPLACARIEAAGRGM